MDGVPMICFNFMKGNDRVIILPRNADNNNMAELRALLRRDKVVEAVQFQFIIYMTGMSPCEAGELNLFVSVTSVQDLCMRVRW